MQQAELVNACPKALNAGWQTSNLSTSMQLYDSLATALAMHGLIPRGGFELSPDDQLSGGRRGRSLVMIGNADAAMWSAFEPHRKPGADPLDGWTERVISEIAAAYNAGAVFPWSKPYQPFQQWAQRAEAVSPSPLGILIHPDYGLWHAYRAALIISDRIDLPPRVDRPSPCDSCEGKPCLSACPVGAFTKHGYEVGACAGYIAQPSGRACRDAGCRARAACPVGTPYPAEQIRFHMAAFYASRAAI